MRIPAPSRFRFLLVPVLGLMAFALFSTTKPQPAEAVSTTLVISQVYGGGGNAGAPYTNDFIEIFNRGNVAVDVTGWSVQYNSSAGTGSYQVTAICPTGPCLIQPGQYFLVQEGGGATGSALPQPVNATGTIAMSATAGRVALVNTTTALSGSSNCATQLAASVDFIGYGAGTVCFEGSVGPAPAPSNTTSDQRLAGGCQDTDNNAGDFFVAAPVPRNSASPTNPCVAGVARNKRADFDGDGKTDVSVWRSNEANWYYISSQSGALVTHVNWGSSSLGDVAVPGDYDGDGKTDFAVWRASEGNWYIIKSSDNTILIKYWGGTGDVPVQGDYDGDNKTDFAIYRASEGNWYILNNATGAITIKNWGGIVGDIPAPGDYDGDLKTDITIYRPGDNNWYIIQSTTGTVRRQNWGTTTVDKLVPADYDGDNKTDIAVYRTTEGNWYIRNSSNIGATSTAPAVTVRNWGAATDLPVPGDYDGDGKYDVAVYRPEEGNWYIIYSSTNNVVLMNLLGNTPVPYAYLPQYYQP